MCTDVEAVLLGRKTAPRVDGLRGLGEHCFHGPTCFVLRVKWCWFWTQPFFSLQVMLEEEERAK